MILRRVIRALERTVCASRDQRVACDLVNEMSAAQAILAVLGPIGLFLASVATLVVKRLLRHFDVLEEQLKADGKLNAEIAVELKLSRDDREEAQRERAALRADISALQEVFKRELSDHRHADLKAHVDALVQRTSQNPHEPRAPRSPDDAPRTRRGSGAG